MTKNDLIKKLHEELKTYSIQDVSYVVNIVFDSMIDAIKRGERIELRGFGSFEIRERKPRMGRNPKSGAEVKLEKRKVPVFKTGKELRIMVNDKK
ncbi:MAG: integration host factor subunit beta [Desulfuromonas sp. SDB]|nr:MAG: integration host factor subunit beta [Smithella sp. SDB]KQC14100.1 MAG: integration host factor subunit beta [Desulfuromonas sp. SDB]